ncbi:hypothetical protein ONZ45_g11772 [Pleurotus djamor]|nr:hypothetical protein ONZ45_g11772 [Pleurotus djamor]
MSTTVTFARQTFFVYAVCQYYAAVGLGLSVLSLIINAAVPEQFENYVLHKTGPFVRRASASSHSLDDSELVQTPKIEITVVQETTIEVSSAEQFFPTSVFASVTVEPQPKKEKAPLRPLRLLQIRRSSFSGVDTIISKVNDAGKKIAFPNMKLNKGFTKRLRSNSGSSSNLRAPSPKMELSRSGTM